MPRKVGKKQVSSKVGKQQTLRKVGKKHGPSKPWNTVDVEQYRNSMCQASVRLYVLSNVGSS